MMNSIFDKRRLKTFSNCKDLVKSMVGTRDGVIFYNDKFRLDLENICYKASMYEDLQQRIDDTLKEIDYLHTTCDLSTYQAIKLKQILGGDVDDE